MNILSIANSTTTTLSSLHDIAVGACCIYHGRTYMKTDVIHVGGKAVTGILDLESGQCVFPEPHSLVTALGIAVCAWVDDNDVDAVRKFDAVLKLVEVAHLPPHRTQVAPVG